MTTLLEQIEREQDIEHSTAYWHKELMTDQDEVINALLEPDMMATWLMKLIKYAEALETDEQFHAATKALDIGPAWHTLLAARQLRVTMSRYMEKRAQRRAEA
jgi:hypothetical protein